jgi:cytochrome P450
MASETSATTSVLDSRTGRMRARLVLGVDWLVVRALAAAGDPLARVLRGSSHTDVYAGYERIRARGDLTRSRLGLYPVASRRRADEILRDPRFGVQSATADMTPSRIDLAQGPLSGSFLELDPPRHTRVRRLVAPAFRPKLIRDFTPVIDEVLTEIMDGLEGRERFDLMTDLAGVFPIAVISRLLGVPAADATHFSRIRGAGRPVPRRGPHHSPSPTAAGGRPGPRRPVPATGRRTAPRAAGRRHQPAGYRGGRR